MSWGISFDSEIILRQPSDHGSPVRGRSRWPVRGRSRPIAADQGGPVRGAFFGDSFVLLLLASAIIRLYLFLARHTQL
jgi:hypothetical protein